MNPKTTWILLALVVGLGAFIGLYESPRKAAREAAPVAIKALPEFDPAAVTAVDVQLRSNLLFRAERTNTDWRLTMPAQYPAHASRIQGLWPVLSGLSDQAHISAQEMLAQKQPLSAFGLDPPYATLTIHQARNRWDVKIGSRTLAGQQVYVQVVGREGIYFADAGLLERLPRTLDDWRDPLLLRLQGLAFDQWEVKAGPTRYLVQSDPASGVWRIAQPLRMRANNLGIARLLQALGSWQVARFVPENPPPDVESLGLNPPEATLTFLNGTNSVLAVQFGKSPTNDASLVYAKCLNQSYVVLVPKQPLEVLRAPVNNLRDNRLLPVPLAQAGMIEVHVGDRQFSVQKATNGGWWVEGPPRVPADPELLRGFLGDVETVNIAEFVRDVVTDFATTYQLDPPKRSYIFRRLLGDPLAAVTNPPVARIDFGAEQDGRVFTRVGGEDSVYAVRSGMVGRLPTQPFRLWDRQIWRFSTNEVARLVMSDHGRTNAVERDANGGWRLASDAKPLDPVVTQILEEALFRLGNLRAAAWVGEWDDRIALYGFAENDHRLTVELSRAGRSESLTLDLGSLTRSGRLFAASLCHGSRMVFELPAGVCQPYFDLLRQLPGVRTPPPDKP